MYVFVFLWTPLLQSAFQVLPYGQVWKLSDSPTSRMWPTFTFAWISLEWPFVCVCVCVCIIHVRLAPVQVFGCFMAAMMAGSTLVKLVSSSRHHSPPGWVKLSTSFRCSSVAVGCLPFTHSSLLARRFLRGVLAVACLSLFIPALRPPPIATLSCFLLFEACVGAYYPSMGVIKSKHVPEEARATIYSLFRVPLNLAVALVLFNLKT